MDVRCTKCGIEYEFDDAKVTAAGVTVKCTSCGHVFKVKREEPAFPSPPSSGSFTADGEWMVRQQGGTIYRFKELTTLQKWIVERKVSRDDEISKTGRTWKRLGEIAELASFFQVVDAANAALQASLVTVQPAMSATEPPAMMGPGTRPGMPAAQVAHTDPGLGAQLLPQPTPQTAPSSAAMAPSVPLRPSPKALPAGPDALDALDADDPVLAWQRSKRRKLVAATAVLVVAAVVAVGWTFRDRVRELAGGGGPALAPDVAAAAAAALRADRAGARAAPRQAIDAAVAVPEPAPLALAWQARLQIADAAEQRELARIHAARAALGGTDVATHESAAKDAAAAADAALAHAYRVVGDLRARAPKLVEGHLAAAAYQLEKGGVAEVKGDLEAARQAASPEALPAVDAEIAVQQALADARTAMTSTDAASLTAAVERLPQSDDGRLRDARATLGALALAARAAAKAPIEAADVASARALVTALPDPDERARQLGALLDSLVPAPPAALDGGPAPAADAGAAASPADAGVTPAGAGDDGAADGYDVVMQKAERARVNGKSKLAHELFGKATKQKPGAPRPWLGLGWAAMDLGRNAEAVRAFKRAVELGPDVGEAHFGLAEALRFTGQSAQAVAEYQELLRIDPGSRDAEVARRAIESLKE